MSFLLKNQKKQLLGNNQKGLGVNKNGDLYRKLISGKKNNEIDLSKLYSNIKEYKIYSPKYKTLKNSRN